MYNEFLDKLRIDLSRFIYGYNKLLFNFLVNITQKIELKRVYSDFSSLISIDTIEKIKQIKNEKRFLKGNLNNIELGLVQYYLDSQTIELDTSLKKSIWMKKGWQIILNTKDRNECFHAISILSKELDSINPDFEELWKIWYEKLKEVKYLSFKDYILNYHNRINVESFELAKEFINSTDKIYTILYERYANSLGLIAKDLTYADLIMMINFNNEDERPPYNMALKCLSALVEELCIKHLLERIKYKIPDSYKEVKKMPCDSICSLIPIDDIYIFIVPTLNFSMYKRIFYTFGKAGIYAAVLNNIAIENIYLGDESIRYGFGFLFDILLDYKYFQSIYFSPNGMNLSSEKLLLARLMLIRKIAAEAIYEDKIINFSMDNPFSVLATDFQNIMKQVLLTDVPSSFFLLNRDYRFRAIHALRGVAFAYLLIDYFKNRYGTNWFQSKKAGYKIIELLECGTSYTAEEIIKDLGYDSLCINEKSLIEDINPNALIML